jgi:hypothetical protein
MGSRGGGPRRARAQRPLANKDRALSGLAFHPKQAIVRFYDFLDDIKPKAQAAKLFAANAPLETPKNLFLEVGMNTNSMVSHGQAGRSRKPVR